MTVGTKISNNRVPQPRHLRSAFFHARTRNWRKNWPQSMLKRKNLTENGNNGPASLNTQACSQHLEVTLQLVMNLVKTSIARNFTDDFFTSSLRFQGLLGFIRYQKNRKNHYFALFILKLLKILNNYSELLLFSLKKRCR